jgi:superfamily II DNA/RNA helicase
MSFTDLQVSENIIQALANAKIDTPSNIQKLAYAPILKGDNVWLKSPTGSGKTLAYILPLIDHILLGDNAHTQVVFFTPTHELAIQITNFINQTFSNIGIKSLALIGKASIERQKEKLKKKPQIIVGSVGRILELIDQKKLKPAQFKYCIIDEADRMLEDDSLQVIKKVLSKASQLQYILGSATIKNDALSIANSFIDEVQLIDNTEEKSTITHSYLVIENNRKNDTIRSFINATTPAKILIFLHKNSDVDFVAKKLSYNDLIVGSIHGEQDKISRANTIRKYKTGELKVLVASDVAARGLDIDDIDYVINYDIPTKAEDYQHRAGRTGRMGRSGQSVLLCNGNEISIVEKIQKRIGVEIAKAKLRHGHFSS